MNFFIQTSNPRFNNIVNEEDNIISEAIESTFPINTENAFIVWNHIYIPVSYKYDLSYMIEDIMKIITSIQNNTSGKLVINWLPDTFRTDWDVEWNNEYVYISSKWECTVGNLENILNNNNNVEIKKRNFLYEWKEILSVLIKGLLHCGYESRKIKGMDEMIILYDKIEQTGIIYK